MDALEFISFSQVKQLDLSQQNFFDDSYRLPLNTVCEILPQVTERLDLRTNQLKPTDISHLQEELRRIHPTVSKCDKLDLLLNRRIQMSRFVQM